ncbi:uncharacterized protein ACRADG_000168 [Cochliomyia hominivorax]
MKNFENEPNSLHSQNLCSNTSDLSTAVNSMRFHRQMMNQYLLSEYLLKEITGSIRNIAIISEHSIEKRFGKADNNTYAGNLNLSSGASSIPPNHKLIDDEGSTKYFSWLKRMNTFDDIQKQLLDKRIEQSGKGRKLPLNRRQSMNINIEPSYGERNVDDELEYMDDGDITGYAFTNSPTENSPMINLFKNHQNFAEGKSNNMFKETINKAGYESGYDDYSSPHSIPNIAATAPAKQSKEIGLKDITDIALTTLAFLSFGMFILQVLMCITMSKDDTSKMVMLPMEGTDNGDMSGDDNTVEIRRKRRSIITTQMHNIESINDLAKRALFSLNAVTSMSTDDGACHYYSLCENNKFANQFGDAKKLWIPMWSIGISWLTVKIHDSYNTSTLSNGVKILNSLKAIILGLNGSHCSTYYKNKCKLLFN